ncbi:MAG: hypothetical protein AAGA60_19290 [Cyanobacteria bacterium P01_E01_bin.42]
MNSDREPHKTPPSPQWQHYELWNKIRNLIYALPNYFDTEIFVRGIDVPDLYAIGGVFSAAIESNLVELLNTTRNIWDSKNEYSNFSFQRQSQTFPDVLLTDLYDKDNIILGIELKAWYALSKENEPSFRFKIDPESCSQADLLVVFPWILSDITVGKPKLLPPYIELAKYVAECRNFYWTKNREDTKRSGEVIRPDKQYRVPYPAAKQDASDKALEDGGGNFGRIARSGQGNLMDSYLNEIRNIVWLGIKIKHWIQIFKAIAEGREDTKIESRLNKVLRNLNE